jgi:hypothetical protein
MSLKYFTVSTMTVALALTRAEVRQSILELATWVALSPVSLNINSLADDGGSAVSTVASTARVVDSNGVEHVLNKVEARELCSKATVEMFAAPVRA